jgi:hypothetical protein
MPGMEPTPSVVPLTAAEHEQLARDIDVLSRAATTPLPAALRRCWCAGHPLGPCPDCHPA